MQRDPGKPLPEGLDSGLVDRFRAGFHPDRPAAWIEHVTRQTAGARFDVAGKLAALAAGRRDFSYPGHDRAVYRLLERLVREPGLERGADVGSAAGDFPAMQLHHGVRSVVVFEVRDVVPDDPRVRVARHDLSREPWTGEPFDLVTCLSTVEHVGLGRYGDPLDPEGDLALFGHLAGVVRRGGFLVASFPEGGREGCVCWNLHRIYSPWRRDRLFRGFRVLVRLDPRRPWQRARDLVLGRMRRPGWFYQPIYLLTPA